MQGLTRNPLADPGLLGVNAGASVAVLGAITLLGITQPSGFVWFAFLGAAVAAAVVAVIGSRGPDGGNPAKLALTGAAVTAGLTAVTPLHPHHRIRALDVYRYWQVGGLTARGLDSVGRRRGPHRRGDRSSPGSARAASTSSRSATTPRRGSATTSPARGRSASSRPSCCAAVRRRSRVPSCSSGCSSRTRSAGLVGSDYRWLLLIGAPAGALVLLVADVLGRVIAPPGEVQAGLVVAFVGAPMLISLVLRRRQVAL